MGVYQNVSFIVSTLNYNHKMRPLPSARAMLRSDYYQQQVGQYTNTPQPHSQPSADTGPNSGPNLQQLGAAADAEVSKQWTSIMVLTLSSFLTLLVGLVLYGCYTLVHPYLSGILWGIFLSILFHPSTEHWLESAERRKVRRSACLERIALGSGYTEKDFAKMHWFTSIPLRLFSRLWTVHSFFRYYLFELGDFLGINKVPLVLEAKHHHSSTYQRILSYIVLTAFMSTLSSVVVVTAIQMSIILLVSVLRLLLEATSFLHYATRSCNVIVTASVAVMLAISFATDVRDVSNTVTSTTEMLIESAALDEHVVSEFVASLQERFLEDIAAGFNSSNVTKTAMDIRHTVDPLLENFSFAHINYTHMYHQILVALYPEEYCDDDWDQQPTLKSSSGFGSSFSFFSPSAPSESPDAQTPKIRKSKKKDNDSPQPLPLPPVDNSPDRPSATLLQAHGPHPHGPHGPHGESVGFVSAAQTIGARWAPFLNIFFSLLGLFVSKIVNIFDAIYELMLFIFVYRFCTSEHFMPETILYSVLAKVTVLSPNSLYAYQRAYAIEEDIISQFLSLFQSFWHITWYHFAITFACFKLCGFPLPFFMGLISVALALFPLFSRYIAPCFVASYVVLFMDIKNHEVNGWTEMILLAAMVLEMRDEWLLSVARKRVASKKRHKNSKKGKEAQQETITTKGGVKGNKGTEKQQPRSETTKQLSTPAATAAPMAAPQREQLPTFIVGTSVVLGLVTYGIQGVVIGPIIFIVSKALYDNFGYDTVPPQHLQLAGLEAAVDGLEGPSIAAAATGLLTARRPITSRGVVGTLYTGNYIANCLQEHKNRLEQSTDDLSRQSSTVTSLSGTSSSMYDGSSPTTSLDRSYSDSDEDADDSAAFTEASPLASTSSVSSPSNIPMLNLKAPTMPSTKFAEKLFVLAEKAKETTKAKKLATANTNVTIKVDPAAVLDSSAAPGVAPPSSIIKKEEGGLTARKKRATFTN